MCFFSDMNGIQIYLFFVSEMASALLLFRLADLVTDVVANYFTKKINKKKKY